MKSQSRLIHTMATRWSLAALTVVAIGCGGGSSSSTAPSTAPAVTPTATAAFKVNSPAGVPVSRLADPKAFAGYVATTVNKYGRPRQDPFALTDSEKSFEASQATERVLASSGSWRDEWSEPEDKEANPVFEPQPPRRLMGIIVGDSVYAIIDMGDGKAQVIYPGLQIPNSPWTVVSIDADHAILHRDGPTLPKDVSVKLQGAPYGTQTTNPGRPGRNGGNFGPGGKRGGGPGGDQGLGSPDLGG